MNKIIPCSHKDSILDNSTKIRKFEKIFLIFNPTLEEFFNDTTHISIRRIEQSPKLSELKNPFEYIVPPHRSKVGTNITAANI